jgi:hypothetical protein
MIGFYSNEAYHWEGRVEFRCVYHLLLKDKAKAIVESDMTEATLIKHIKHFMPKDIRVYVDYCVMNRPWRMHPGRRVAGRPSPYYDDITLMVNKHFPRLMPYAVKKRMGPPQMNVRRRSMSYLHANLLTYRKLFKVEEWERRWE